MSGKPSRGWDASSHEDLLLTLLEEIKPSRAVLTSVSERMREKGYSYSFDAIKYRTLQHVQKLRKNRDTNGIQAAGAGSATTTPRKKATTTPRKRKSAKNAAVEDDDAEDEKMKLKQENDEDADELVSPSPSKRAKRTPKPEPEEEEQPVGEI
ncbi:hypothetical protein CEP53_011062 [Fusarium sp. AF-6]|nr:hypothetical protein CEP53_011062 [Fusarium sp. AF-6]